MYVYVKHIKTTQKRDHLINDIIKKNRFDYKNVVVTLSRHPKTSKNEHCVQKYF